jgi:tetratricopeptide (TPR) repeat protein
VEALDMARHEQAVLGRLSAPVPDNTDYRHLIAFSQLRTAAILTALGRLDEAERSGQAALGAFEALAAADPKIDEYRMDVGTALAGLARIDEARGAPAQALERLRRAIGQMGISSASQASAEFRILRADALAQLGRVSAVLAGDVARAPAQRAADAQRACEAYQEASTLYRRLAASWAEVADDERAVETALRTCKPRA